MSWYVIHCHTGKEEAVRSRVKGADIARVMVPRRIMKERKQGKWCLKERVVFPGYVFVQANMTALAYYDIRCTPWVIRILGTSWPQPLEENEALLIVRLANDCEPLGPSSVIVVGDKINVIDGPLRGFEGYIVKLDARRCRAKVNINILGEPKIIELAADVIKKA